jgi:hypothetical protein
MFHGTPTLGSAVAGEINVKMVYPQNVTIPTMAKLMPQVRVCNESQQSEWIAQGIYYIDTRERTVSDANEDVLVLHGYDAMLKAEQMYNGDILGDSTDVEMVDEVASQLGLSVDSRTYALMTEGYTIPLPTGYSCREVLGYIASMYCGCFIMSDTGELRLVSLLELPQETSYLADDEYVPITFGQEREEHQLSGQIVSFVGDGSPLVDLSTSFSPVQDFHGYDHPWPAGGGKNKVVGIFRCYFYASSAHPFFDNNSESVVFYAIEGTTYTRSSSPAGNRSTIAKIDSPDVTTNTRLTNPHNIGGGTVNTWTAEWTGWTLWYCYSSRNTSFEASAQVEVGSTATAYEPYENICPIYGWTNIGIKRIGKNFFDKSDTSVAVGYIGGSGGFYRDSTSTTVVIKTPLPKGVYTISRPTTTRLRCGLFSTPTPVPGNSVIFLGSGANNSSAPLTVTIANEDMYFGAYIGDNIADLESVLSAIQIEFSSTKSEYEPYQGAAYIVDLDGTVYGGTVNVVTGVLTVDKANISSYNGETLPGEWISDRDAYAPGTTPTIGAQVVYELATPQTYQLSPTQVETLIGTNNVWSDTNGDTSLTYSYGGGECRIIV